MRPGFDRLVAENIEYAEWSPTQRVGSSENARALTSEDNADGLSITEKNVSCLGNGGFGMIDKEKCDVVFEHLTVDGYNMYEKRSFGFKLKNKFDRTVIDS